MAAEGWGLVINGMRAAADVQPVLDELRALGVEVTYAQGNIGEAEGREAILSVVKGFAGGALNLLVNNAGVAPKQRLDVLETTEENYDRVMDINLKGAFFLSQAIANQMVAAKQADSSFEGKIINIGSISATLASINRGEYCLAKAGIAMMSQVFAVRLGAEGIPVYEVRPGVTRTDMTSAVAEKYDKMIEEGLCLQPRWGEPGDSGKVVASLARGDFPYSTGQVILVDGGLTVPRL